MTDDEFEILSPYVERIEVASKALDDAKMLAPKLAIQGQTARAKLESYIGFRKVADEQNAAVKSLDAKLSEMGLL